MGKTGNVFPTIVKAEHIGPDDTGDNIEAKRVATYVWNGSTWDRMSQPGSVTSSTTTLTNVSTSGSNATLLSSNSSRKKAVIVNDAATNLYVKYGTTATSTSFSYLLQPNDTLEEYTYTGRIDGILASGTGTARVSEM